MNIFNSLGSNYDKSYVWDSIFTSNNKSSSHLRTYLERRYKGKVILTYKGREALELALRSLNLKKNSVAAINGFTCFVVYQTIRDVGLQVAYIDIPPRDLNFSPKAFKNILKKNPGIQILIIQNTLGYPCQIEEIAIICRENNIILIEDLTHSVGSMYNDGQEAGSFGDFVIFSFSQSKILDAVSGGALLIRNTSLALKLPLKFQPLSIRQQLKDKCYPLSTYVIRSTYKYLFGKILHNCLNKTGLISRSMSYNGEHGLHFLPAWYRHIALRQFMLLHENIEHRQKIASIYASIIDPHVLSRNIIKLIPRSTNLRFPIFIPEDKRDKLIAMLYQHGIHIPDIWYDAPVAPKVYLKQTNYQSQCPNAESISSMILNLPTHKNINENQAIELAEIINSWLTNIPFREI